MATERIYSVVLAEDHMLVRQGARLLLEEAGCFEIIEEASNGLEAVSAAKRRQPDLLILDVAMPHATGIEVIEEVRRWSPKSRIAILTGLKSRQMLQHARDSGADGIFLKSDDTSDLAADLRAICEGEQRMSAEVAKLLVEDRQTCGLTPRELQILHGIARGETNGAIGARLCISAHTVDNHRTNIMRKLGAHSAAELLAFALREGLLDSAKHI